MLPFKQARPIVELSAGEVKEEVGLKAGRERRFPGERLTPGPSFAG